MNAKEEFIKHIKNLPKVIAATIFVKNCNLHLQESYNQDEYNAF